MGNNGIIVNGGAINAENIVVSKNASLHVSTKTSMPIERDELMQRLDCLILELEKTNVLGEAQKQLIEDSKKAKAEVSGGSPNKGVLEIILSGIEKGTSAFSGIASAIAAVRSAIDRLFGV